MGFLGSERIDTATLRSALVGVLFFAVSGFACGGPKNELGSAETKSVVGELSVGAGTSDASRAAYYAAEVAKYRDIATHDRELSAAYARATVPAAASKNWNVVLKARADARAVAADQIATQVQTLADFHVAQAAKAVGQ